MSGEFDRIRAIVARLGRSAARDIGDDCAVIPEGPGTLVVSTDLAVEGVHFRTEWLTLEEIGWRCAAGALSDLAAQGAAAVGLVASVGVPKGVADDAVVQLMGGVGDAVRAAGGLVLGGDLSSAPTWLVDMTVFGRAERPVRRNGAGPGDSVWVSGTLGGARAALTAWQRGEAPAAEARVAFARPIPRIALGQRLAAAGASAMIDLSDGLSGDAPHIAEASGVELVIDLERLPVHPSVPEHSPLAAAKGGEDYELLFTLPTSVDPALIASETGIALTRIGTVQAGQGVRLLLHGIPQALGGFDHFA